MDELTQPSSHLLAYYFTIRTSHVVAVALVPLPVVGPVRMFGFEEVHVVVVVRTDHFGAVVVEHRACDVGL